MKIIGKILKLHKFKEKIIFSKYKMIDITKETWEKSGVEVIVLNGIKWRN